MHADRSGVRVARKLRGGAGLDPKDPKLNRAALLGKTPEEIVDLLLADSRFVDAALDFGLFFLGGKPDFLRAASGDYNNAVFDFPAAISGARAVARGGDFLQLFEYRQPQFASPMTRPFSQSPTPDPDDAKLSDSKLRRKLQGQLQAEMGKLLSRLEARPDLSKAELCTEVIRIYPAYFSLSIPNWIFSQFGFYHESWLGKLVGYCFSETMPAVDAAAELRKIIALNERLFERLKPLEGEDYKLADIGAIRELDVADLFPKLGNRQLERQAFQLPNSSTNYNRKRAAYVLKRYFCDDLAPLAIEAPAEHAQGQHGSEPACMACHYKLDPMAGFFRDLGAGFADNSTEPKILFDDNATLDRGAYQAPWRAASGAGREWNVGYVRSPTRPALNDYGSSMEDLFGIIRRAPEVRECLTRRAFEYFAGEDRTLDAGYLTSLAQAFTAEAAAPGPGASSRAFKSLVRRVMLSRSFAVSDPVPGTCYDFAPGAEPGASPPCEVAHLLEKNCVQCHDSGEGGLDLGHWTKKADGSFSFPHQDAEGREIPRRKTFESLLERLTTADPSRRMPRNRHIPAGERERLHRWALEEAGK